MMYSGYGVCLGHDLGELLFHFDEEVVCLHLFCGVDITGTLLHDMDQVARLVKGGSGKKQELVYDVGQPPKHLVVCGG
jgi:hypothetical protein